MPIAQPATIARLHGSADLVLKYAWRKPLLQADSLMALQIMTAEETAEIKPEHVGKL